MLGCVDSVADERRVRNWKSDRKTPVSISSSKPLLIRAFSTRSIVFLTARCSIQLDCTFPPPNSRILHHLFLDLTTYTFSLSYSSLMSIQPWGAASILDLTCVIVDYHRPLRIMSNGR